MVTLEAYSEAYSGPCQTYEMEVFERIVNGFSLLTVLAESYVFGYFSDSEFPSEPWKDLRKKLYPRCLVGSWIQLCINYFLLIIIFPPYVKEDSIVHGQIHVTLISTYLFSNENYNSASKPWFSIDGFTHLWK